MTGGAATCVGKNKIGSIRTNGKNHVTGVITDGGIRMRREIVEKHVAGVFGVLGWRGLTVGDLI